MSQLRVSAASTASLIRTNPPRANLVSVCKRWLSVAGYGAFTSSLFRATTAPSALRGRFERFAKSPRTTLQRKYPALAFQDHRVGALTIEALQATPSARCVVLHLHGGGFVFGSAASYRNRAMRLSYRFDAEVFVPDYRLAPEHVFPAALDDALLAYQYVRALRPGAPIVLSGDSAGGGLALSLMLRLRELDEPLPQAAILLSPWTDLSSAHASRKRGKDRWLTPRHLAQWASHYAAATDRRAPLLSPVFADLSGLPPFLALVGEDEILFDDATRVVNSARRAGVDARLLIGKRMQHDWPLTLPWLEESQQAWRVMRQFVQERTTRT
jgi:acetyl esterase/lipase